MRIRKRFPPPSDPQLSNHIPAVVQQEKAKNESLPSDLPNQPQPSDQLEGKATRWVIFGGNCNQENMKVKDVEATKDVKGREKVKNFGSNDNDNNKECTPQVLGSNLHPQLPASFDLVEHGRWCEGVKEIPLKKKRDESYNSMMNKETAMELAVTMKFPQENGSLIADQQGTSKYKGGGNNEKKSKRGSVIAEGSRCSRANGRGWRCCQQTLVGYSLCEHHLGKGRSLRTITTSVPNSSKNEEKSLPSNVDNMDEKRPILMVAEKKKKMLKRKKLGMVKARSLSSLLCQTTDNAVAVAALIDVDNYIKKDIAAVSAPNVNSQIM